MNNYDPSFAMNPTPNYQGSMEYPPGATPRSQSRRSRFGFHIPSPFPRPRSSAAKPNPNSSFDSINEEPISDDYYSSPDNYSGGFQNRSQNSSFKSNYPQKRLSNFESSDDMQNRSMGSANSSYSQNHSMGSQNSSYHNRSMGSQNSNYSRNRSMSSQNSSYSQNTFPNSDYNENFPQNQSFTRKSKFSPNQPQNSFESGNNFRQKFRNSFNNEGDSSFNVSYEASDSYPNTPFQQYGNNQSYNSSMKSNTPKWKSHNASQDMADSSYTTCSDSSFTDPNLHYNPPYQNTSSPFFAGAVKPPFQGNAYGGLGSGPQFANPMEQVVPMNNQQNQYQRYKRNMKRKAPSEQLAIVRCEICSLDFTSQIPLDMHLQGAKHARKLKSIEILKLLQSQGHAGPQDTDTTIFRCEPCNVSLNGVLQLQTHFEGNKHKQKVNPKAEGEAETEGATENGKAETLTQQLAPKKKPIVAPAIDPDDPLPKLQLLSCGVCGITVNSSVQLEQHLQSKKHKAKVEGTPLPAKKKKFWKKGKSDDDNTAAEEGVSEMTAIPDISTSFVKGETVINN